MKRLFVFLLLTLSLCLTSCGEKKYSTQIWSTFDTVVDVSGYFESEEEWSRARSLIEETLFYYDDLLNAYEDADFINLKAINESSGKTLEISRELYDFLTFAKEMEKKTDGALITAFGSVTGLWKDFINGGELPDKKELEGAFAHTSSDMVLLEDNPYRVTLLDPDVRVDAGSLAKGWVGDRLREVLEAEGFDSLIINLGGNVVAIGSKKGKPWSVGIRSPEGSLFDTVEVSDLSVVTSGNYERVREYNGILYHHIISPDTLYPADCFPSVTVIPPSSATADALSTALFVLPLEEGKALLEKFPEASAVWITDNGAVYSDNYK
ncbi:MAG: FAD:protein FMN transferase [Clostridia bacterium]|nr:FAD:protein FMN transferase [Clostridia bacterium]